MIQDSTKAILTAMEIVNNMSSDIMTILREKNEVGEDELLLTKEKLLSIQRHLNATFAPLREANKVVFSLKPKTASDETLDR